MVAPIEAVPVLIALLPYPDTSPLSHLPFLAWAESVDEWDPAWSEGRKRTVIKASRSVHERKGTIGALQLAMDAMGLQIEVTEWWQETPPAIPFTFRCLITVDQDPIPSAAAFGQVVAVANATKNLRSRITGVDIKALTRCDEFIGGAAWLGEIITIAAEPA